MTKRRFPIGLSALVLGLALFGLAPSEAKAIEVMCSNEYGQCEVQDNPSWISCSCNDESSTGGTGGDEYQGLSEAELMAVCEAELSYCLPNEETGEGTTTFGTSDTGEGEGTSTSDTGEGEGTSTTSGEEGTTNGEEGTTTGGEEGTTGGDSGTSDGEGDSGTTGGEGDSGTGGEGDSGTTGETGGGDSGGESGSDGDGDGGTSGDGGDEANDGGGAEGQGGDGDGCSVANDSGFGALALFGMLGLLGLRSRKRAS